MLSINMEKKNELTFEQLCIVRSAFEKLSQLTTLYYESDSMQPMSDSVVITCSDLQDIEVYDEDGVLHPINVACDEETFVSAITQAMNTIVTFETIDESETQTITSPLLPCILNPDHSVTWNKEPHFIVQITTSGMILFEMLDGSTQQLYPCIMHNARDEVST